MTWWERWVPWIADWPGKGGDTQHEEMLLKKIKKGMNESENTTLPEDLFCPSSPAVSPGRRKKTLESQQNRHEEEENRPNLLTCQNASWDLGPKVPIQAFTIT